MLQLSDRVKTNYIQTRYFAQEDMWRLLHPKHFVNVLLIHHMDRRGEKEILDVAAMMRQGLSSEATKMQSTKSTIQSSFSVNTNDISDIFKPFKRQDNSTVTPNVILIDGAPGMGKTTLCKEIAYRWANSLVLNDIKLLFFIYLRDPDIAKILNLENFIHYFYNFDKAATEFSRQCADILIHRKNDDIAIVLDGYDEYADEVGNLFLTRVLNRKAFTQCKLIITTRPIATDKLQNNADIRVEVMGFNDDSKKEYIQQELSNSAKIEKLSAYLKKNKDINSICYIPMIMTILVFTFKETEELPANQIELYNKFITIAVSRYVQKLEDMPQKDILPLQKLPTIYKTYLLELSNFAFETLRSDKIVFTETDVQKFCPNLALDENNYQGLGLLKSTQYFSMKKVDTCISYNFLHLSIQEFLAAYYICYQEPWVQFSLLRNTIFFEKYMNVWIMHADLNKYAMSELYNYLVQCNGIHTLKGFYSKIQHFNAIECFNELIKNCAMCDYSSTWQIYCFKNMEIELNDFSNIHDEKSFEVEKICLLNKIILGNTWNKIYLSLYHNIHSDKKLLETFVIDINKKENAYWKIASELLRNTNLSVMIINTSSLIGYRANTEQFNNSFNVNNFINKIVLRNCFISDETSVLLSSFIENSKLVMLNFIGCTFSATGSKVTFNSLGHITTIVIMIISDVFINEDTATAIGKAVVNNTNLIHLEIGNYNLQKEAAMKIVTALKNIRNLKNLILHNINLSEYICDDLAVAICVNSNLELLNLSNNHLQHYIVVVAQALNQVTKLSHLNLNNSNMSENVVDALALAIELNPSLASLHLKENSLSTLGMIKIAQSLSWSSNLSVLDISNNQINEGAADAIAIGLLNNKNIKELYLSNNNLGAGIVKITAALQNVSTLIILDLNNNNGTEEAADHLAAIAGKNRFQKLFLANCNLKLGMKKIACALSNINTLTELNLNNNGITDGVACSLAAAIESNPLLTTLKLSNNKLQAKGIQTISQSLRKLSSLQVLHIDYNQITKEAANDLASVVLSNRNLRDLYLNNNELQDGIIEIANALKNNIVLQRLVLNNNNMSENVADAIADALINMSSLKVFAVMNNRLKTKGIVTIAKSLSCLSELTLLNIHNNQITKQAEDAISLVIQNNSKLEDLSLGENDFTGTGKLVVSLKDAYALKVINLVDCRMSEKVAKELETALMNKHLLKTLVLDGNYLKSSGVITISKSLRCISTITLLNLYDNQLTEEAGEAVASIILSNTKLESLYLGRNKLKTGALQVISALKNISTLKVLDFNDNYITECVADELAIALDCNSSLSDLRLRGNGLKTRGFIGIAKALSKLSTLKSLNFRNNQITKEAVDDMVSVLSSNTNMTHLYLGSNDLQEGIVKIMAALNNSTINTLDLDNNNISSSISCQLLADILHNCSDIKTVWCRRNNLCLHDDESFLNQIFSTTITSLDLSDNYMSDAVADQLTTVIANNKSLQNLHLRNNNFKSRGAVKIMQSLSTLKTFKSLNLGGNLITEDASDSIASVISNNPDLTELYLGSNYLANGLVKIAKALEKASKIKIVHFDSNSINELVAEKLALVFFKNNIEELNLSYNNLNSSSTYVFKALSKLSSLKILQLSSCCMTATATEYLAVAIDSNYTLKTVKLQNNHFNTKGIMTIAKSLRKLSTLKILNIRNNVLRTKEAVEAISSVLINNCTIEQLYYGEDIIQNQAAELVANLKTISTLVKLYLININMKEKDMDDLVVVIKNNPLLEDICLAGNSLMSTGLSKVLTACKINATNLLSLDIQSNSVCPEAMATIPYGIFHFHSLEAFHLGGLTLTTVETLFYEIFLYFIQLDDHFKSGMALVGHNKNILFICNQSNLMEICSLQIRNRDISSLSKQNYNDTYIVPLNYSGHVFTNEIDKNFLRQNMLKTEDTILKLSNINAANLFYFPLIKKLKVISLEFNNIDESAAFELAAMLQYNKMLQQLWLKGNKLNAAGALFILNSLECISTLKVLDLSYNNITYQVANNLADVINNNHTLEQLWLDGNNLLSKGVVRISAALCKSTTLRILSLSNNNITDEAAEKLSIVPNNCVLLEDLSLGNNNFQTAGIRTIAQSLCKLFRLRKIDLFNNRITEDAAEKLADAISNCHSLQELYLSDNMLKSTGTIRILQALKFNRKLQILTLSNNKITDTIVGDLSDVLVNNNRFYVLSIGGNDLKTAAALKIAKVVKAHNTGMQLLNLCDNNVSSQGKDEISVILSPVVHLKLFI